MKTITVVAEDRVGLLADMSYVLGKSNINIEALTVDIIGKKAIIALTVKDQKKTVNVLEGNGFKVTEGDSIVVKLPNHPEAISNLANRLAEEKVNIENMHVLGNDSTMGVFALHVDKHRKAVRLLGDVLINPEEAYGF